MGRAFDGANDNIAFGSDASVDDFTSRTVAMHLRIPTGVALGAGQTDDLLAKSDGSGVTPTGWQFSATRAAVGEADAHLQLVQDFATADGVWVTPNNSLPLTLDEVDQVGVVYSRAATGNDPTFYIGGTTPAVTETGVPLGASGGDAAQTLRAGEDDGGNNDLEGTIGWLLYDDILFSAADMNRHRWWGVAPGGPSTVSGWWPMWTDLVNRGTATANGTATGTIVIQPARVERMYAGMMGVGR